MKILLILSGDRPGDELLNAEIADADLVIAVDGGANVFRNKTRLPDIVIGDLDSLSVSFNDQVQIVKVNDQNLTDLQKALHYIHKKYEVDSLNLLGAGGGRVDHMLNNLHICASLPHSVKVIFKREISIDGRHCREIIGRFTSSIQPDLKVIKDNILSVLPVSDYQGLQSRGLKWEITNFSSSDAPVSQSNVALINDPQFSLANGCVYIAVYQ